MKDSISRDFLIASIAAVALFAFGLSASAQMASGTVHMTGHQALMSWTSGMQLEAQPTGPKPSFSNNLRLLGGAWYDQLCTPCHGPHGDGAGPWAGKLSPRPRDFTKGVYEFRSTPTGTLPTDEDIWKVVSGGLHGTAMVPWITYSAYDRWALVAYVQSFSPRFASEPRGTSIAVPTPPAETPQLVTAGAKLFKEVGCIECHGAGGVGDGPSASTLKDAGGRPIRPLPFDGDIFRRGSSMRDIFLTVRTGLDGTPMPSYAESLTPDQTWAVAAYVRSFLNAKAPLKDPSTLARIAEAHRQEHTGMMIDMPGMGRMPMTRDPNRAPR